MIHGLRSDVSEYVQVARHIAETGNEYEKTLAIDYACNLVEATLDLATGIIAEILANKIEKEQSK